MKLKLKGERQSGYTLVEMMVAIAIFGVITGICGLALQQIVTVPERGDSQVDALHELQNVIHWVSLDAGSAEAAAGGSSLTLTMPDDAEVVYSCSGTTLYRHYGDDAQTIARNITNLKFTVSGRSITIEVTSAPENRWNVSENRTYQVAMRPAQDETDVQIHQ
jgi:prepilin-type N-terminal cleavage/methylation domain-containing protein